MSDSDIIDRATCLHCGERLNLTPESWDRHGDNCKYRPEKPVMRKDEPATSLTRREWFAGKALQGMLSNRKLVGWDEQMIEEAFKISDAMIAEGEKHE